METKVCSVCKKNKNLNNFSSKQSKCKDCRNEYIKAQRKEKQLSKVKVLKSCNCQYCGETDEEMFKHNSGRINSKSTCYDCHKLIDWEKYQQKKSKNK